MGKKKKGRGGNFKRTLPLFFFFSSLFFVCVLIILPFRVFIMGSCVCSANFSTMPSVPFTKPSFALFFVNITAAPLLRHNVFGERQPFLSIKTRGSGPCENIVNTFDSPLSVSR